MLRSSRVLVGVLLAGSTAVGLVTAAGSASAATAQRHSAKASTFTGKISCALTGTVTASPALTLSTSQTTTLTYKATLSKCTGSTKKGSVSITGASLSGTSKASVDCTTLAASGLPALSGSVTYKAKGGSVAATKFSFNGGTMDITSSPVTFTFPASGGKGTSTGSFSGKASLKADLPSSDGVATLTSDCKSGLKSLKLASGTFKA